MITNCEPLQDPSQKVLNKGRAEAYNSKHGPQTGLTAPSSTVGGSLEDTTARESDSIDYQAKAQPSHIRPIMKNFPERTEAEP